MMIRRTFVVGVGSLLAGPLSVQAQQTKVSRIGVLLMVDLERTQQFLREDLRALGHVDGQTVRIEFRAVPAGQEDRLPDFAAELARLKVDVIIAQFTPAVTAAKAATAHIPIVMAPAGNPVETGLITSLARPGGNVTGVGGLASELGGKSVELMREIVPSAHRVAALLNAKDPFTKPLLEHIQRAARAVALDIQPMRVNGSEDLEAAFSRMKQDRIDGVIVQPSLPTRRAAELAVKYHLPSASLPRWFAEEGGLMAYSWDTRSIIRQAASYVDKILKGARPADLPVEQPTKFELVINLKTARALGLTISPALLQRADQVIE